MNGPQAWAAALGQLQTEMSKASYDTWVRSTQLLSHDGASFTIGVPNAFARDWLDTRLTATVAELLTKLIGEPQTVQFVVWHRDYQTTTPAATEPDEPASSMITSGMSSTLNSRYTFDNFVIGPANRLAHAAAQAVAEHPAQAYNPLFIYSSVGLGKTHLLHAIGNCARARGSQVLYVSAEEFTNDLINAIRTHSTAAFRDRYRRIDILLIDDIQFIAGKESTQEELFHTFNSLHAQDKQIVLSSDRPPKAMVTLEERLRSRFEWGLIADIQPADLETRMAILRAKAEKSGRQVASNILESIARQFPNSIRELEGALTRVLAYSDLRGQPLSQDLLEVALTDLLPQRSTLEPRQVIQAVASAFGITCDRLTSRDRSREIALPRQVAMYLLREEANASLPQIGAALGGRDHTTVMYACDKIADLLERDDQFRRRVVQIRDALYGRRSY